MLASNMLRPKLLALFVHSVFGAAALAAEVSCAFAAPRMPYVFSDHMVLQSDAAQIIWGWADPGEAIEVHLAGTSRTTSAANDGRWSVALPPLPAGGPFVLEVRGAKTLRFKDVAIGEVWIASGQSNMTYALSGAANAGEEIPKANDPDLRFLRCRRESPLNLKTIRSRRPGKSRRVKRRKTSPPSPIFSRAICAAPLAFLSASF